MGTKRNVNQLSTRLANRAWPALVILTVVLLLALGCGSGEVAPTSELEGSASLAGRYRLKSQAYEEDYEQTSQEDY
jgi:hypothetical protein